MADPNPNLAMNRPCVRTVTGWTILFMVLLRVAIGWHFAYEGVWKLTQADWRATGYLVQSAGPLRPLFVGMVHDPDGLERLNAKAIKNRIDERYAQLVKQYELTDAQRKETDAYTKRKEVGDPTKESDKVYVDAIFADPDFQEQLADYKKLLTEIEDQERTVAKEPQGGTEFNRERLMYNYGKKAQARQALLARAEAPLNAMQLNLVSKLTPEQMKKGPPPKDKSQTAFIDFANMWGLTLVGVCLMLGLLTRYAALGGVGLLCLYYFAMPPWPGLPEAPMSEGHYLIVNKNMIEAIALLMIATSRVGRWAGLDAYLSACLSRNRGGLPTASTPR